MTRIRTGRFDRRSSGFPAHRRPPEAIMARSSISLGLLILMICPAISAAFEDPPKGQAAADWPSDPAILLKRLRARDGELDNRSVETEQRWVERVSPRSRLASERFNARRFGQPDPGSPPEDRIPAD